MTISPRPGGKNLRALITMSPVEVDEFLRAMRALTMCTLNADGSVHAVAMWYGVLDGSVVIQTKAKSQKVLNLRRDPRLTVLVDTGERYEELRGVELVGRGEIVEDPDELWAIGVAVHENNSGPLSADGARASLEATLRKRVGVRLHVERTVSWDHRKLPPTAGGH